MSKSNLVVVGICDNLTKTFAEKLSHELDVFFADFCAIVEYEIENEKEIEKLCGLAYLERLKSKVFDDVLQFENTLVWMPFSIFSQKDNLKKLKKTSTLVFLNFDKKLVEEDLKQNQTLSEQEKSVQLVMFDTRRSFAIGNCNLTVDIKTKIAPKNVANATKIISKHLKIDED